MKFVGTVSSFLCAMGINVLLSGCGGVEGDAAEYVEDSEAPAYALTLEETRICVVQNASKDPNAIYCRSPGLVWWKCTQGAKVEYKCEWFDIAP
jgi:hypothetical protein